MRRAILAILFCLAACTTADAPDGRPTTTTTPSMSAADYQAALTALDTSLKPAVDAVRAAPGLPELAVSRTALVSAMSSQVQRLRTLKPPPAARAVHEALLEGLENSLAGVRVADVAAVAPADPCGVAPSPLTNAVGKVDLPLHGTYLANAVKAAARAGFTTGTFIPAALPPPAPPANRRLPNGQIIERSGPRGTGQLTITNGPGTDVAVSVVTGEPSRPQAMIYVQRNSDAVLTGINGTYQVYFKSGTDWDEARKGFTEDCAFHKFDESFDRTSDWEITLETATESNTSTTEVPGF